MSNCQEMIIEVIESGKPITKTYAFPVVESDELEHHEFVLTPENAKEVIRNEIMVSERYIMEKYSTHVGEVEPSI